MVRQLLAFGRPPMNQSRSALQTAVVTASRLRVELLVILLCGVLALATGMREAPLVDWDEATYAEVAHEAVASRNYLHFTWNGDAYLKKPPLLFWMMIGSFRCFGESPWAARLPSVLAGLGTLLLLYFMAAEIGRLAGVFAGLLPLGFYLFVLRGGRECATDGPLVFFNTLAVFALMRSRADRRWLGLVGLAIGLAVLSKGLAGLVPLGLTFAALLLVPDFANIGLGGALMVAAVMTAVILPWLWFEITTNPRLFWDVFVKQESLMRIASHIEDHRDRTAATLPTFLREIRFLWVVLLPLAGLIGSQVTRHSLGRFLRRLPSPVILWTIWMVLELAVACAVRTKLSWYVLPALPPVALLCGSILGVALTRRSGEYYVRELGMVAVALLVIEMPAHWRAINEAFAAERDRSRPAYDLGVRARALGAAHGDRELVFVGNELPTLVYYSGMRAHFVAFPWPEFPDLANSQVVLREPDGALANVGNLAAEWSVDGPRDERVPISGNEAVCRGGPWKPIPNDLEINLAR